MKRLACAALLLTLAGAVGAATPQGELVPAYERVEMANGLTVLLLEHHELPLVNFEFRLRGGAVSDPLGKEGLADLTLGLMRKGTDKYSSEQLAEELDFLGGTLSIGAGLEAGAGSRRTWSSR